MMCTIIFIAGASIHAYRRSGPHLVAFEKKLAIFDAILALCVIHSHFLLSMVCNQLAWYAKMMTSLFGKFQGNLA